MNGWTKKRRQQQSELIHGWKPWEQSTGPKTPEGKQRSAQNAYKHGLRRAEILEMNRILHQIDRGTWNIARGLGHQ